MDKNQIFIKNGTEYKKMTKELLAESNLAELIGDRNSRDFGISERKWLSEYDDPGGILGGRSYGGCL